MRKKELEVLLFSNEVALHFEWYYKKGYITTRDGNACAKLSDSTYAVTASGVEKHRLTDRDIVLVDENGKGQDPSIETLGHIAALKATGKKVSVHVHSPCSTAFYSMREPFPFEWPELTRYTKVGNTIDYLTPGSESLHNAIDNVFTIRNCDIVVLRNHGVLAVGDSLDECREHIERLEHTTDMWLKMLAAERNSK